MGIAISIEITVKASVEKAWKYWTDPVHITKWNFASDDWHCPSATNDLRDGGTFSSRMEAKDGSFGFDFEGIYEKVEINKEIIYGLGDGRKVEVTFLSNGNETTIKESFDTEDENSVELQKNGWQAILNNYKKHVEND